MGLWQSTTPGQGIVHQHVRSQEVPLRFPSARSGSTLVAAALLLALTACGSSEEPGAGSSDAPAGSETTVQATPQASPSAVQGDVVTVPVTFSADSVDPLGKVVKLKVDQKLVLDIKAPSAGEIHVHSSPEQEISYPAGTSQAEIVIKRPGVVEVESHTLDKLVLQLEVR